MDQRGTIRATGFQQYNADFRIGAQSIRHDTAGCTCTDNNVIEGVLIHGFCSPLQFREYESSMSGSRASGAADLAVVTREPVQAVQRLDEEVLAPHHTLVDAKPLALMVAAVLENALPAGRLDRQELGSTEGGQDGVGVAPVVVGPLRRASQLGELQQAA